MITVDVFEQLGFFHKLIYQRVCRTWKSSLAESHSILLIDSINKIKPVPHSEDDEIVKSLKLFQAPFREALRNTQALVINFAQNSRIDKRHNDENTAFSRFCTVINMKGAIAESVRLRHVILGNTRRVNYSNDCWLQQLGIVTLQRPVIFSLVHCNFVRNNCNTELRAEGVHHQLFPTYYGECQLRQVSLTSPLRRRLLLHRIFVALKDSIFPYPNDQLVWLKTCRERLKNEGKFDFGTRGASEEYFVRAVDSCIDGYYDKGTTEPPEDLHSGGKYDFVSGHDYYERFAVMVSYLARQIANGKLDLPPPPHPVPLCPTHTSSTICTCLAQISDIYKPYITCANNKIHELPAAGAVHAPCG